MIKKGSEWNEEVVFPMWIITALYVEAVVFGDGFGPTSVPDLGQFLDQVLVVVTATSQTFACFEHPPQKSETFDI